MKREQSRRGVSGVDDPAGYLADSVENGEGSIRVPTIHSFRHFLEHHARIKINGGPDSGKYKKYTFVGREALIQVCDTLDLILGNPVAQVSKPAVSPTSSRPDEHRRATAGLETGDAADSEVGATGDPLTDGPSSQEQTEGTESASPLSLLPPVKDSGSEPLTDSTLVLAGGAQFGKTVLELNLAAYLAAVRFLSPGVYLPDDKLAADIVDAKFRPDVVDQIPWFAGMCKLGKAVNKSGKAVDNKGAFMVTDNVRKAVGLFRGLQKVPTSFSLDVVVRDEEDDIPRSKAKFLSGRLTASALRLQIVVGTQRIHGAGQNKQWEDGSQGVVMIGPIGAPVSDPAREEKAEVEKRKAETSRVSSAMENMLTAEPLTLTLSPEEREQPLTVGSDASDCPAITDTGHPASRRKIPPLPGGEGRGEGEGVDRKVETSNIEHRTPNAQVAQVSKPAVSPTSSRPDEQCRATAGLETGDTADSEVGATWINPEDHWPQVCRVQLGPQPSPSDPRLTHEGDFRRPEKPHETVATVRPGAIYYLAHPDTGEPLDRHNPQWHHRRPERIDERRWSYRISQLGCAAIDLAQIVGHWARAVADDEEMMSFCCDRLALPRSAAQSLTPQILERSRTISPFDFGAIDRSKIRVAGLDTGNRCWLYTRELHNPSEKRCVRVDQIALGDLVSRIQHLWDFLGLSALFIDEAPAVDQARTLALIFNGLSTLDRWPRVDWNSRDSYFSMPYVAATRRAVASAKAEGGVGGRGGLSWDGRLRRWRNLRCAVVRFSKKNLGMGIEHGAVEFQEAGQTKFVPLIECNRFETIDRVLKEFLTPTENVMEVVEAPASNQHPASSIQHPASRQVRQHPSMRLPLRPPGSPGILETLDAHLLTGSQRVKDDKTGELGSFVDKCDNHLLLADAYSALAEIAHTTQAPPPGTITSVEGIRIDRSGFKAPVFVPIWL